MTVLYFLSVVLSFCDLNANYILKQERKLYEVVLYTTQSTGNKTFAERKKKKIISISVTNPIEIADRNNKQTTHSFSSVNTAETPHLHDVHQVKEARFEECKTDATYHT